MQALEWENQILHKEEIENVEHKDHKDDDDGDEFYKDDLDKMKMVVAKMRRRRKALRVLSCIGSLEELASSRFHFLPRAQDRDGDAQLRSRRIKMKMRN